MTPSAIFPLSVPYASGCASLTLLPAHRPCARQLSPARWNARQLLINLSLTGSLVSKLKLYGVPDYVHGANVPGSHYERPAGSVTDDLEALPTHLTNTPPPARQLPASGLHIKPPPLKTAAAAGATGTAVGVAVGAARLSPLSVGG